MAPNIVEATPLPPEPKYDDNGVLLTEEPKQELSAEERDAQIKKLEQEMLVLQFKSELPTKAGKEKAEKILPQFQRGTINVENWKLLSLQQKKMYLLIHGTVFIPGIGAAKATRRYTAPMTDEERTIFEKKRAKNRRRNQIAKASRKRNRK